MISLIVSECLGIILAPLLAAIVVGLLGQRWPKRVAHQLTIAGVGLSFILSTLVFIQIVWGRHYPHSLNIVLYHWGKVGDIDLNIGFMIDRLSALMMLIVTFVSWMVHIYTIGYMKDDPGYRRFFSYISLFTFAMLILVMANNFLQLFFGWEAVGLMSYLLIGFWFKRESAITASLKAFLVNRLGDFGFLLGIGGILVLFNTLDYVTVFQKIPAVANEPSAITLTCILLFIGAMGKSAQVPLHVWLPDSMEGPTPISALIHAATMVTAGVFMLARFAPLFEHSDVALNFILIIGSITALSMGLMGVVSQDIKRIIAYSTLSQLGYMMTAAASSAYAVAIFHLMTHAFFKALLFLAAGSVIIAMHHEQDIRKMGGLKKYLPITYACMLIASLSMVGFPFLSGFYSKDLIIEAVKFSHLKAAPFAYFCVLAGVFITALYSFRLLFLVFHGPERIDNETKKHLHESPWVICGPLIALAVPSLIVGFIVTGPLLNDFLPPHKGMIELKAHFHGVILMAIEGFAAPPFWLLAAGALTAWVAYLRYPNLPARMVKAIRPVYIILINKYGFDTFNQWVIVRGIRAASEFCSQIGDKKLIDGIFVNGLAYKIGRFAQVVRHLQSGYLYHYVFAMIAGFLGLLVLWEAICSQF